MEKMVRAVGKRNKADNELTSTGKRVYTDEISRVAQAKGGFKFMRRLEYIGEKQRNGRRFFHIRDNNTNEEVWITKTGLEKAIINNQVMVDNLPLRVDTKQYINRVNKLEKKMKAIIEKAISIDSKLLRLNGCYLIYTSDDDAMLLIPKNIHSIGISNGTWNDVRGNLKVIGGAGLVNARYMFTRCKASKLDISEFDTSNIKNMQSMFANCGLNSIDFSNFSTVSATDMSYMFASCNLRDIDLSSFIVSGVEDMEGMFMNCTFNKLDISHFKPINLKVTAEMFHWCNVPYIDINNFGTGKKIDIDSMYVETVKADEMFIECPAIVKAKGVYAEESKNR